MIAPFDHGRLVLARRARFIAYPANVRPGDGDQGVGLQLPDQGVIAGPVVFLFLAVGPLTAGAVKPDLVDWPIMGEQLAKLVAEVFVVFGRIAVGGLVAVPGRKIETDANLLLTQCIHHLANDVALAAPPGRVLHTVFCELRRPKAETIVVLGSQNQQLYP